MKKNKSVRIFLFLCVFIALLSTAYIAITAITAPKPDKTAKLFLELVHSKNVDDSYNMISEDYKSRIILDDYKEVLKTAEQASSIECKKDIAINKPELSYPKKSQPTSVNCKVKVSSRTYSDTLTMIRSNDKWLVFDYERVITE